MTRLTLYALITAPTLHSIQLVACPDCASMQCPDSFFFGREVAAGCRKMLYKYALPQRRYLGPTSMDTELSFIMCNHALVRAGLKNKCWPACPFCT